MQLSGAQSVRYIVMVVAMFLVIASPLSVSVHYIIECYVVLCLLHPEPKTIITIFTNKYISYLYQVWHVFERNRERDRESVVDSDSD